MFAVYYSGLRVSLFCYFGLRLMEEIGKLLDHLGYATPLLYAGAAYRLFAWLDENASDKAKAALATATKLRALPNEQVATALVEIFDRIYTSPLLHWRAALRVCPERLCRIA